MLTVVGGGLSVGSLLGRFVRADEGELARFTARRAMMMREVGSDADGNGPVPGPQGGYAGRDDADADFPGAPVPIGDALPGRVFIDVLPIQDRADDAACRGAMVKQAQSVTKVRQKLAKRDMGVHKTESHQRT